MVLYSQDLDRLKCDSPDCDHTAHSTELVISGRCCPGQPTFTRYDSNTRTITVYCAICRKDITEIHVASDPQIN